MEKIKGNLKKWVEDKRKKIRVRGWKIEKDLGNTNYSKLAGFKEKKKKNNSHWKKRRRKSNLNR